MLAGTERHKAAGTVAGALLIFDVDGGDGRRGVNEENARRRTRGSNVGRAQTIATRRGARAVNFFPVSRPGNHLRVTQRRNVRLLESHSGVYFVTVRAVTGSR